MIALPTTDINDISLSILSSLSTLFVSLHVAMVAVFYPLHLRMPVFPFLVCSLIPLAPSTCLATWEVVEASLPSVDYSIVILCNLGSSTQWKGRAPRRATQSRLIFLSGLRAIVDKAGAAGRGTHIVWLLK